MKPRTARATTHVDGDGRLAFSVAVGRSSWCGGAFRLLLSSDSHPPVPVWFEEESALNLAARAANAVMPVGASR